MIDKRGVQCGNIRPVNQNCLCNVNIHSFNYEPNYFLNLFLRGMKKPHRLDRACTVTVLHPSCHWIENRYLHRKSFAAPVLA